MRKAAAPSTGGERIAPIPPAERSPPAASLLYPAFASIGYATEPRVTVVATPLPEGPPRRKEASVTVRPAPVGFPPIAAKEKSMKNLPAPENSRKAPQMVKRMMKVEETSMG